MQRGILAEVVAMRALMTAWMSGALVHNPDYKQHLQIMEEFAAFQATQLKLEGIDQDNEAYVKEVAAHRVSEIISEVRRNLEEGR